MFSLFKKKSVIAIPESPLAIDGHQPLKRTDNYTVAEELKLYKTHPSIIDHLPWSEYLPESNVILLDDGVSVGAVFEVIPVGTEGRTVERLEEIRDIIEDALQDSFEERDTFPWVVQFYCQDENDVNAYMDNLCGYIKPWAEGSTFTTEYLRETERHMRGIAVPQGLFIDTKVTGAPWRGQQRKTRLVIYRYVNTVTLNKELYSPLESLNQVCDRFQSALAGAGIKLNRQNGEQIHAWLLRWFNPSPQWVDKSLLYQQAKHVDNTQDELGLINDFSETLWFNPPRSDVENNVWWFDDVCHKAIPVERIRRSPEVGHLSGEIERGDNINALMDLLPESTIVTMTIVVQPQDVLEARFNQISKNAIGDNVESMRVRSDVEEAKSYLGERHKIYRFNMICLLKANTLSEMSNRQLDLNATLLNAGLQPVNPEFDVAPLNGYLRALPMCFNPALDKKEWYSRLTFVQHIANLLPVFGRDTGTGHPGITFFNRGGEDFTIDPLNSADRAKNAHLVLFGPTGSGKSATLNNLAAQLMAIHRPRLFIAEAGNSFGLFADYCQELGLTVNKISIKPGSGVSLAPFADAHRLLENPVSLDDIPDLDDEEDEDSERDILGEMEIAARLMITGGEPKEEEKLSRADRGMIREAIMNAARTSFDEGQQMLPSDLQRALFIIARDTSTDENGHELRTATRRARAEEMAESLSMFTTGFDAEIFNQPGTPWPEADLTLIDLGTFAREGYEAQLAVSYISLVNTINNIAERDQFQEREIVFITDEAHMITTNPLLSPYVTKVVKMWRKLGAWLWLATQNLEDFPDIAEKMLNMIEWWLCLVMPPKEVEQIARFKQLTPEQKNMLLSATKLPRCYTEGVVLASSIEALFRVVPPSIYLALGMTEKEEKAARRELMNRHNITELEAARMIAKAMDKARKICEEE